MHHNPSDPSFQRTLEAVLAKIGKYFNKSILKHILCIMPVACIAVTDAHHLGAKAFIKNSLRCRILFYTTLHKHRLINMAIFFTHFTSIVRQNYKLKRCILNNFFTFPGKCCSIFPDGGQPILS